MKGFIICLSALVLMGAWSQTLAINCDAIPAIQTDFKKLVDLSPFNAYQTNNSLLTCAKVVFTGPGQPYDNYTGSSLVITNSSVLTFQLTFYNNDKSVNRILCPTGLTGNYNFTHFNIASKTEASLCIQECNGKDFITMICIGKTPNDFNRVQSFLDGYNITNYFNAQASCAAPTTCNYFTY